MRWLQVVNSIRQAQPLLHRVGDLQADLDSASATSTSAGEAKGAGASDEHRETS